MNNINLNTLKPPKIMNNINLNTLKPPKIMNNINLNTLKPPKIMNNINLNTPAFSVELQKMVDGFRRFSCDPNVVAVFVEAQRIERWRTDPLELMPYWRMAGDALRWRKACWALGDFFNNLGNL